MVVVRPPQGSYVLPPGLCEESFDAESRLGRVSLLAALFNVVSAVNEAKAPISDLVLVLSGPLTYFYRPGGFVPWAQIPEVPVHPVNRKYVGFRESWGSLALTDPLMDAFVSELERSGFTLHLDPPSVTVEELGGTRITLYNPVEAGFTASLWDVFDPGTAIYVGPPGTPAWVQETIALLPDKRTTIAAQFLNDTRTTALSGSLRKACRPLAGAAQALGKIRLRADIVGACERKRFGARTFGRFLAEAEEARATIDALWRYQRGLPAGRTGTGGAGGVPRNAGPGGAPGRVTIPGKPPLEPVSITIGELETGEFTALCQDLGIVCIAAKSGDAVTVSMDRRDLERSLGELGTDRVPEFSVFFEEVAGSDLAERDKDRLIRVREPDGTVRYYDLRKE